MSAEAERAALETCIEWHAAFNARDNEGMISRMHFPHVRIAGGRLHVWETPEDFVAAMEQTTPSLEAEGWAKTDNFSREVIHSSEDKVHLSLRTSRIDTEGNVYHVFSTLWIFTLIEGRWGVHFRSSYIGDVAHGIGATTIG
ncbi:MAG: hypothetical protein F4Z25_11185 [Chloroflexi bacterium]|nr:hypothetical protein [Chloroflexota bacterium]MYE45795.1 hypothetical protein [Chloroflexota bacterium]